MYLSEVKIRNFRNFLDCTVPFNKGLTVVIGENNSGKSNLLKAIEIVFSPDASDRTRRLSREDFCSLIPPSDDPPEICIACTLTDFTTDEEKSVVARWMLHGGDSAQVTYLFRCRPDAAEQFKGGDAPPVESYDWTIFGGEVETNDRFEHDQLRRISIESLGALRDAEARLRPGSRGFIAKIVRRFDSKPADELKVMSAAEALNKALESSEQVKSAEKTVNDNLRLVSGASFAQQSRLTPVGGDYGDMLQNLMMEVHTEATPFHSLSRNGLGSNNIVLVAAVLAEYTRRRLDHELVLPILAIEEPEAHLHPQLQRTLNRNFHRASPASQVIATTHSTHITSSLSLSSLVLLHQDPRTGVESLRVGSVFLGRFEAEKEDLERYLDATRSTLFFAKSVLLVEGIAEALLMPILARHWQRGAFEFDDYGISVVPVNSLAFKPFMRLFAQGGVKRTCVALMDSDTPEAPLKREEVVENATVASLRREFSSLMGTYLKIVTNLKTLEYDIAVATDGRSDDPAAPISNERPIIAALKDTDGVAGSNIPEPGKLKDRREFGLAVIKAVGRSKGRFAQALSRHVGAGFVLPGYVDEALKLLRPDAGS